MKSRNYKKTPRVKELDNAPSEKKENDERDPNNSYYSYVWKVTSALGQATSSTYTGLSFLFSRANCYTPRPKYVNEEEKIAAVYHVENKKSTKHPDPVIESQEQLKMARRAIDRIEVLLQSIHRNRKENPDLQKSIFDQLSKAVEDYVSHISQTYRCSLEGDSETGKERRQITLFTGDPLGSCVPDATLQQWKESSHYQEIVKLLGKKSQFYQESSKFLFLSNRSKLPLSDSSQSNHDLVAPPPTKSFYY